MAKLKINHYVVGPVQTNCYFAINDETKELIIIDPGYSPKQLAERVRQEGCTSVAILLTHGHFDHATGAADLAKEFSIPVYAYETEKETLENEEMNLCHMTGEHHVFHADIYLRMSRNWIWQDFISGYCTHRDIHRGDAVTISHTKMWYFPEIHCFAHR